MSQEHDPLDTWQARFEEDGASIWWRERKIADFEFENDETENRKHAILAAAAPDLLAAVKECFEPTLSDEAWQKMARAAIAKAEG